VLEVVVQVKVVELVVMGFQCYPFSPKIARKTRVQHELPAARAAPDGEL
tara:strand:- start:593 stop:739 length:147 start_codon:yes stop_codon:yes gene_type:complete